MTSADTPPEPRPSAAEPVAVPASPPGPDSGTVPDGGDHGLLSPGTAGTAVRSATGDTAYLQAMLDAEAALTRALVRAGQAPRSAVAAVEAAARAEHYDVRDLALRAKSAGNPVVPLVADLTHAVAVRDPDAAAQVHRGATSQDIMDTAAMLVARRALGPVLDDLDRAERALAALAAGHRGTPMPGRTLTQHAVPTTFGLKAAGWRSLVLDARDRLAAVREALPAQLGGAAGTLAAFHEYAATAGDGGPEDPMPPAGAPREPDRPHDPGLPGAPGSPDDPGLPGSPGPPDDPGLRLVAAYAAETGLAEPALPWHTLRTPVADLGAALAFTAGALGKTAADVLLLSRTETGEVTEGSGGGSSAMPHKSNPVRATLVAAAARQVPPLACVLLGALAAEDERPAGAWHAEWQTLRQCLRLVGGAARDTAELAEGLRAHAGAMRAHLALTGGRIVSERLTAALSPLLGRARAAEAVSAASRRAPAGAVPFEDALLDEPALRDVLTPDRLRDLLDPSAYLGSAAALTDRALRRRPRRPPENR